MIVRSPGTAFDKSTVVVTCFGVMSFTTFAAPRSRTSTVLAASPVISNCAGTLWYSRGTSIPISEEVSLATATHNVIATANERSLRNQLWVIQCFTGFMASLDG